MNRHHVPADRAAPPVEELDRVRLTRAVVADCGRRLEAGSKGTVVSVYGSAKAFCVEFTSPTQALATVDREDIDVIAEETVARLAPASKPILR